MKEPRATAAELLPELSTCNNTLRQLLKRQIRLLDAAIDICLGGPAPDRSNEAKVVHERLRVVLPPMIQAIGSSCHSILTLSSELGLGVRDCFPIARAVSEGAINVAYMMADAGAPAERAWRHAIQRAYRDRDRQLSIAGTTLKLQRSRPEIQDVGGLAAALAEFTSKNGREIAEWTNQSIDARLAIIEDNLGRPVALPLKIAYFSLYANASQIVHGSLYGALVFLDPDQRGRDQSREQIRLTVHDHLLMVLFNVIGANEAVLAAVATSFGVPQLKEASASLFREIYEIPLFKKELSNESRA